MANQSKSAGQQNPAKTPPFEEALKKLEGVVETMEADEKILLVKPETFMNLSGVAIKPLMTKNELEPKDLILVYDELALPWGSLRIRPNGSAAGHNGVQDVIEKIGTQEFPRVRLGVHPGHRLTEGKGADYLLSRFTRRQNETLDELIGLAADATESIIAEGVSLSMTRFNRRAPGTTTEDA